MIYFLINNNYHLDLDLKLADQLYDRDLGLIQVPYSLDVIEKNELFNKIICIDKKVDISIKKSIQNSLRFIKIKRFINKEISIKKNDILLIHTEIGLINLYFIQLFYRNGARIFLLEDGTATICDNNLPVNKSGYKEKIRTFILKYIYNIKHTQILNLGNQKLPRVNDYVFSGVIINYGNQINRNIPLYKLRIEKIEPNIEYDKGIMFFSQSLYMWFLSEEEYIEYIDKVLLNIHARFSPFYFKYHPSEKESVKNKLNSIIKNRYPNIKIIEENIIAEKIIENYPIKFVITINSTAALNLIKFGITPIFLNNLFLNEFPFGEGEEFAKLLITINCMSPVNLDDINPTFNAFNKLIDNTDNENRLSIKEIINN